MSVTESIPSPAPTASISKATAQSTSAYNPWRSSVRTPDPDVEAAQTLTLIGPDMIKNMLTAA